MAGSYLENHSTPEVLAAQKHYYGRTQALSPGDGRDLLTAEETDFIAARDSFYMATVTSHGWPYLQHRGGPPGFLKVLSPAALAFADYTGNRQMLTTGNLAANDRVALFLMDYRRRERLKIMGHARVLDAREHPELARQLAGVAELKIVERIFQIEVVGFNWNCPKYITPRFTEDEVREFTEPLRKRIAELEAQLVRYQSPRETTA
jgi:predicted pyridoxine 5'-phosphate oxidase superfamily flavin-nucleotide-binding protein